MPIPSAYHDLIDALCKLPGLGKRSAERIAFHLLKQPPQDTLALADTLRRFRQDLKVCSITGHVSESDPCSIATDPTRDHATVLVVEQPSDVIAIEQTGTYHGSYHVLMGRIAPLESIGPGELNVQGLLDRVRKGREPGGGGVEIKEVILGTNPTLEGDGTALYLAEQLEDLGVKVTRLARGMPTGVALDKVSKAVLADAIHSRRGEARA